MLQTLFYIPLWPFQLPWILVWVAILAGCGVWQARKVGAADAAWAWGPPIALLLGFAFLLLDNIVEYGIDPQDPESVVPLGIAVRGYGLMLLLGITAGVLLAIHRGAPEGLQAEHIVSLAIHLAIVGIVGARLFFVIQYWSHFAPYPYPQRLWALMDMTKGGLVVYGGFFGAVVAAWFWSWRQGIQLGKLGDLIAPSFLVGLSLGRLGCLLNGCCFGGYCDLPNLSLQFPAGSPPYLHQIEDGRILGIETEATSAQQQAALQESAGLIPSARWRTVTQVPAGSDAADLGLEVGDVFYLQAIGHDDPRISFEKKLRAGARGLPLPSALTLVTVGKPPQSVPWSLLPPRAQPIHPTQIYSSVTALLLAVIVAWSYRWRRFDGQSFALMMILYAIARFVIEWIRQDEPGQFGTDLTISQWICLLVLVAGLALMGWGFRHGKCLPVGQLR